MGGLAGLGWASGVVLCCGALWAAAPGCWPLLAIPPGLHCDVLVLACPGPTLRLLTCATFALCCPLRCTAVYRLQWFGFIKDYDGGTLMECRIHPTLPYASFPGGVGLSQGRIAAG